MREFACSMDIVSDRCSTIMFDTGSSTSWSQILMYQGKANVRWLLNQRWLKIVQHDGVLRPHLEYFREWSSAQQLPGNVEVLIMNADAAVVGFTTSQPQFIPHCENHQVTSTEPSNAVSALESRIVVIKTAVK